MHCTRQRGSKVQIVSFTTAVEINAYNFHLHLTRGQTNKTTRKQTQWHKIIHLPQTHVNLVPCLAGTNSNFFFFFFGGG